MENVNVLLVEDDSTLAVLQVRLLSRRGATVFLAHSGTEALRLAREEAGLDLVLMDTGLGPDMDGFETATRLLAFRDLPVVFMASTANEGVLERLSRVPAWGYVDKGAGEVALVAALSLALDRFRACQASITPAAAPLTDRWQCDQVVREKDLLLKELQHRVKNTLAMITALVDVEKSQADLKEVRDSLNRIYMRIQTFSCLHGLMWKTEGNPGLDEYLKTIAEYLVTCFLPESRNLDLELDLARLRLDIKAMTNLGIIVNEALTNSIKHGFGRDCRGRISLKLWQDQTGLQLRIQDDGCGCPAEQLKTDGSGFGLVLIRELVSQMQGTCRIDGHQGMLIEISIPLEAVALGGSVAGSGQNDRRAGTNRAPVQG